MVRIWRSLDEVPADLERTVVTIGNFDGVHLGHQLVLRQAREVAGELGIDHVVAVTFDPHPIAVLRPEHAPPTLTTIPAQDRAAQRLVRTTSWCCPFTRDVADWTPERFVEEIIVGCPACQGGRRGCQLPLRPQGGGRRRPPAELGPSSDFVTEGSRSTGARRCGPRRMSATACSPATSRVRGGARPAVRRSGTVIKGDHRGRDLGFPTANVPVQGPACPPTACTPAGSLDGRTRGPPRSPSAPTRRSTASGSAGRGLRARPRRPRPVRRRGRGRFAVPHPGHEAVRLRRRPGATHA